MCVHRRPNIQSTDNVESVDMEMSDEEGESKKARMLVDMRSQDRDMRVSNMPPSMPPGPQHHHTADMDMRMMGPGGPMGAMVCNSC